LILPLPGIDERCLCHVNSPLSASGGPQRNRVADRPAA
jgi:hypothetical protein